MNKRYFVSMLLGTMLMCLSACQAPRNHGDSVALTPIEMPTKTQNIPIASPSAPPTILSQPATPTTQLGEVPAAGSSLTFTQHGVKVTVTNLQISSTQSSLDFIAQVEPDWGFTFAQNDFPAQDVRNEGLPSLVDETGHVYQLREYQGGMGTKRYVDPQTGIAYTGGRFIFEPVTGSRLEIAIPLALQTVHASQPIRFKVTNLGQDQSLQIDQPLIFGELSARVKAVEWKNAGNFELTVDGSTQEDDLRPVCLYLYQDPQFPPASYKGCAYQDGAPIDLTETLTFNPLPDFSKPVEVRVAADIVFLVPFRFTWIRAQR